MNLLHLQLFLFFGKFVYSSFQTFSYFKDDIQIPPCTFENSATQATGTAVDTTSGSHTNAVGTTADYAIPYCATVTGNYKLGLFAKVKILSLSLLEEQDGEKQICAYNDSSQNLNVKISENFKNLVYSDDDKKPIRMLIQGDSNECITEYRPSDDDIKNGHLRTDDFLCIPKIYMDEYILLNEDNENKTYVEHNRHLCFMNYRMKSSTHFNAYITGKLYGVTINGLEAAKIIIPTAIGSGVLAIFVGIVVFLLTRSSREKTID